MQRSSTAGADVLCGAAQVRRASCVGVGEAVSTASERSGSRRRGTVAFTGDSIRGQQASSAIQAGGGSSSVAPRRSSMSGGAVPPPLSKSTSTADEQRRTSVCGAVMAAQFGKRLGARAKKARYREILQTFPAYRDVAGLIELVEWAKQAPKGVSDTDAPAAAHTCSQHPCSPPCSPPPQQIQFRDAEVQKAVKVEPLARVMHLQPCEEGEVVVLQVQGAGLLFCCSSVWRYVMMRCIVLQGDAGDAFYVVFSGVVSIYVDFALGKEGAPRRIDRCSTLAASQHCAPHIDRPLRCRHAARPRPRARGGAARQGGG